MEEFKRQTIDLCPIDLRKLQLIIGFNVEERYKKLSEWYQKNEFRKEFEWTQKRISEIEKFDFLIAEKIEINENDDDNDSFEDLLHDAFCDKCNKQISGVRWNCLDCFDYDLCNLCMENSKKFHESSHIFRKFEKPKDSEIVKKIFL